MSANLRLINSHAVVGIAAMFATAKLLLNKRPPKREPTTYRVEFQLAFVKAVIEQHKPYEFGAGQRVIVNQQRLDLPALLVYRSGELMPCVRMVSVDKSATITGRIRQGGKNYYRVFGAGIPVFELIPEDQIRADWTPISLTVLRSGYQTIARTA